MAVYFFSIRRITASGQVIATLIFPLLTVGAFCFRTESISMAHLKKRIFSKNHNFMILFCKFVFFNSYSLKKGCNVKLDLQKCKVGLATQNAYILSRLSRYDLLIWRRCLVVFIFQLEVYGSK
jgi:hypothetical protein